MNIYLKIQKELREIVVMSDKILIIKILLYLSLFCFIFIGFKFQLVKKSVEKFISKSNLKYKTRSDEKEILQIAEGNFEETKFINKIDLTLERSGLKEKYKNLTAELFILLFSIIEIIVLGVSYFIVNDILISITISFIVFLIIYSFIKIKESRLSKKIERDIMTFLDVLEGCSSSQSDIVQIMKSTSEYVGSPLNKYLDEFSNTAEITGDIPKAFYELQRKIKNENLNSFLCNIEIASRGEANYSEIINDIRYGTRKYLKNANRLETIIRNGKIEILACIILNIFILMVFKSLSPNLLEILKETFMGNVIIGYNAILMGALSWKFVSLKCR